MLYGDKGPPVARQAFSHKRVDGLRIYVHLGRSRKAVRSPRTTSASTVIAKGAYPFKEATNLRSAAAD